LRSSELRGLRWSDIKGDKIHVRQRADELSTKRRKEMEKAEGRSLPQMGPPKSTAGDREIPMSDLLINILKRWRLACPAGELVFPNGAGKVENHANIANRGWYAAQIAAGITYRDGAKYNFHAARHFFASLIIAENYLPKEVQQMMGHASLQMTFDRYGHLFPAGEDRTKMEKAASFLHATKVA
jgi:integrase